MRTPITLISIALLAACSSAEEEERDPAAEPTEDVVGFDDSENADSVRITSKDGSSVRVDPQAGNDAQWPDGFAAYPGATVISDIAMGDSDGSGNIIGFRTDDPPQEVADFYREQAQSAGFEVQMDIGVNEGRMVAGEKPDGTGFAITASRTDTGTQASLTVGQR